jgi:hypothetical protein
VGLAWRSFESSSCPRCWRGSGWLYAHFSVRGAGPFGINAGIEYLLMAVVGGTGRSMARYSDRPL